MTPRSTARSDVGTGMRAGAMAVAIHGWQQILPHKEKKSADRSGRIGQTVLEPRLGRASITG